MSILKGLGILVGVGVIGFVAFKLLGILLGILIPVALVVFLVWFIRKMMRAVQ